MSSGQAAGLAAQQQALLALLKGRPVPAAEVPAAEDPYLDLVRGSRGLEMLQMITAWWRRYDVERLAPLTSRALTCEGRFEDALTRLGRDAGAPAAISALVMHFLEQHVADTDPLIAAVASTERVLALAARGDRSEHEIPWDRDPAPVLNALLAGHPPGPAAPGDFRVTVSRGLPGLIAIERRQPGAPTPTAASAAPESGDLEMRGLTNCCSARCSGYADSPRRN